MDIMKNDPFAHCELKGCNHDLGRGLLISELECCDGPHSPNHLVDRFSGIRYVGLEAPLAEAA